MNETILMPTQDDIGKRVDKYIAENIPEMTRNAIQGLINDGNVVIELTDLPIKKNYKMMSNTAIKISIPEVREVELVAQDIPIDIVYEDDDIVVVNKARGMVVHPAVGNWDGTLVNALMYHCGDSLSGINGEIRPGIVHRIDKDTSGLLVVAKNDIAHQRLTMQLQVHSMQREYEAVVFGSLRADDGTIDKPIGRSRLDRKKMAVCDDGREAITHYQVVERYNGYTYMHFKLETGRTHQIRVHMAAVGHPIIGDPLYGLPKNKFAYLNGQCLHARKLTLMHPVTGEVMEFTAKRPEYFEEVMKKLTL